MHAVQTNVCNNLVAMHLQLTPMALRTSS